MQIFSGQSISSDVVFGPLHFLTPAPPTISAHSPLPPEEEWERFSTAHRQAVLELAQLYDQAVQMVGEKLATIFAIHAMLLDDQDYQDTVYSMIFSCGCTAEHASKTAMDHLVSLFEQMDSPYMQARASDVRAISDRMLRILTGRGTVPPVSFSPSILVSTEFAPSPDHHPRPLLYFGLYCYARQCTEPRRCPVPSPLHPRPGEARSLSFPGKATLPF